ncbi:hypothetical protein APB26_32140 [Pseudomonas aeruginosa]|uniref:hypothetical protein n=1 Tax=Pseudomonas aeruginosa TaxID=287 RepID=UPI00071B5FAE|nr:hypothetical protein [Pseudomonas aeruginosa]KSQ21636.1 hypothetical protein APB26_32140 [Pseudomonas aeruginosa]RPV61306.1 hypothetical protein IPC838_18475 [Pseudomonas aeruginosa]
MRTLPFPRQPTELAADLAREIVRSRFVADHKDHNALLRALREQGESAEHAFCGASAQHSALVVDVIAEENLRKAPYRTLERKIKSLSRQVDESLSASMRRFNPERLGGTGAAGRQRDQARDSDKRNLLTSLINRIRAEIARREGDDSNSSTGQAQA